jgi:hypothetical protein
MEALAHQSLEVLQENLMGKRSADVALKALELTSRALGYGAKQVGVQLTQNFVVAMPQKAADGDSWVTQHSPRAAVIHAITLDTVIDAQAA